MHMPSVDDCLDWLSYLATTDKEIGEVARAKHPKHWLSEMRSCDFDIDGDIADPDNDWHVSCMVDAINLLP